MSETQKRTLPKEAVEQLKEWLYDHLFHPYPSDVQKNSLSIQTNLEMKSINNWFINARRRSVRPLLDKVLAAYRKTTNSSRTKDFDIIRKLTDEGKLGMWARSVSSSNYAVDVSTTSLAADNTPTLKNPSRPRRTTPSKKHNVESETEEEDENETEEEEEDHHMDVDEDTSTTNDEQSDMSNSESEFEIENEDVQAANTLVKIKMTVDFDLNV